MKRAIQALVILVFLGTVLGSCGSHRGVQSRDSAPRPGGSARISAPHLVAVGSVSAPASPSAKTVSNLPQGIRVTWSRSTDAVCVGYYLYRDTQSIPDSRWGDPTLRVNGGNLISQPDSGANVSFDDAQFTPPGPPVGSTWYYRVTAVDDLAQESDFSNEINYTVQQQHVDSLDPPSGYWGDTVTIAGNYFGMTEDPTDSVEFTGIFGTPVKTNVMSWSETSIQVTVPSLAATGPVSVVIAGSIAYSPTDFVNPNPFILDSTPQAQFRGAPVHVTGGNFGAVRGNGKVVFSPSVDAVGYPSWSDGAVDAIVPGPCVQGDVWLVDDQGHESNHVSFIARPRIISPAVAYASKGEAVTITGVGFGTDSSVGTITVGGAVATIISSWSDTSIEFVVPSGAQDGSIFVKVKDGLSNGIAVTIQPSLAASMTGITNRATYAPPDHLTVTAVTDKSAERAELVIDGVIYRTIFYPQLFVFDVDPILLTNQKHFARVRVYRRSQEVSSDAVFFYVRSLPGDVNGDDVVDGADPLALSNFLGAYGVGCQYPDANYNGAIDGNGDGVIDEREFEVIARNWGRHRGG